MRNLTKAASLAAALLAVSSAQAATISDGQTIDFTVLGTSSVYAIFGHPSGDGTPATQFDFSAGAGNVFTFDASGTIGCCGSLNASFTPDGSPGNSSIIGANGLSNSVGNTNVPLMGVFVDADPFGNVVVPATLSWDRLNPGSLSPLLNQVFYIGDGRAGFNDPLGSLLSFTAPSEATHLFIGVVDALGFNNPSGSYGDNPGSFSVSVHLERSDANGSDVPEPAALGLLGFGLAGAAVLRRRAKAAR